MLCSASGCDRVAYCRGLCTMHYLRLRKHGATEMVRPQYGGVHRHSNESRRRMSQSQRRHGGTGTPEYLAWKDMKQRCTWPSLAQWKDYGGRGITVCREWMESFEAFLAHIGPRPSAEFSLDRIDVNGNYEPGNVRWATRLQQRHNRRRVAA